MHGTGRINRDTSLYTTEHLISLANYEKFYRKGSIYFYRLFRYFKNIPTDLTTGWPTKMSLFFFCNNFYKNNENFKVFSPQLLEVYRILLVETILE